MRDFPVTCALFALGVMACVIAKNSGNLRKIPAIPDLGLTSGQGGVDMVKGSDPFWESGKLRVGVAEIEMIPTVDGGSEIWGENQRLDV